MEEPLIPYNKLYSENQELKYQLEEANETIDAIRNGRVDALVVKDDGGENQLYTLKSADQTYRVFIEKMAEGAVTLNEDGIILYSNSRFARMLDTSLEKVIGATFSDFVNGDFKRQFDKLFDKGWQVDCKDEILLNTASDNVKPYLLSCTTLELDEGTALSIIVTDLSAQKETQQQLKIKNDQLEEARSATEKLNNELETSVKERTQELFASREHFKFLANNIPQMIWTNLPDGRVNFNNQQWYEYTGLSIDESSNFTWQLVIHPDDVDETIKRYKTALQTGNIFEIENRYKRGVDGSYRWHLNRGIPLHDELGEIILWVGTATDIEDQKRAMEKKDEFIGIASHELKTPLTSLKGYLQIIGNYKDQAIPQPIKLFINKATEAVNKLQYLVNDLLDVSKINAGRLEYQMSKVNVQSLINACFDNSRHIYPHHQIEKKDIGDAFVKGNAERLEQVLMNFISNAVKYSQNNKHIVIDTQCQYGHVRISVTDFGIGLSDAQKEKIFERFYRVEDKKFLASGLGMGLYICSEIIKAHDGNIGVISEFGKGSTFYFDLPLL
ncbi:ATP-binding protein [Mucilaginibacter sp. AW1-3]